ncbi:hypothetical protein PVAP13_1NG538919 [Panicum virgatum]|uniref:Uncharacterized protein n=1 Tax=Panicum virgatum TaxID=38727 RepID=A0A8T0X637_PANVG|nr:hypothetical protein PVAP13_1NG538919 [Panicum virgatum]
MEPPVCQCPPGSGSWRRREAGAHRGYPHRRERTAQHRIGHSSSRALRDRPRGAQEFGFRAACCDHMCFGHGARGTLLNVVRCHCQSPLCRSATGDAISIHFS